jgi:pimeloyl-ACP methyl ester carboxylesterase
MSNDFALSDRIVRANGVDICVETFGDPSDPAILLIHGATASMLAWGDGFADRLASAGRFVIRYDHRDTGRSVSYKPGAPPYTIRDLACDAIGLLDVLEVDSAHLVGRSMGGALAMLAALDHPERVTSLTLMATSPGGPDLSPPSSAFLEYLQRPQPDWSDREAAVSHYLDSLRVFDGGSGELDEEALEQGVRRELDRTINVASAMINHFVADPGDPIRDRLGDITAPTLVIHGENDPAFPLDHARTTLAEIADADLLILANTGHLILPSAWGTVIPAIVNHTVGHPHAVVAPGG